MSPEDAAAAHHVMGLDTETFTPIVVAARVVGWTAHVVAQTASNALVDPLFVYTGPAQRAVPASLDRSLAS